jgi:hypothetical protein
MTMTTTALPEFAHLVAMTDRFGTFEHADHALPRREHGYCTDDVARLLVVTMREPDPSLEVRQLARGALRFLADAQGVTGDCRNRRSADGRWHGRRTVDDCWGRSLWGLGTAAVRGAGWFGQDALAYFEHGTERRSPWPRAMAFAALGAAAVVGADPRHHRARALLADAVTVIGPAGSDATWPWPEPRLTYANAVLPDAMMAAGAALDRPALVDDGLRLLGWLLDRETVDGHLSPTPVGGAGEHDVAPRFDQQPIEAATMADACARAALLTGSARWDEGVRMAAAWFDGANDATATMWDPATGGGFDGLEAGGPNLNQGAESTLALISARQQARLLAPLAA